MKFFNLGLTVHLAVLLHVRALECLSTTSTLCLQVRKSFGLDHETITTLAEEEAAGSEGVNFLPFLTGERTPNWPHSYGVLTGLRQGGMRPGLLYRAALEGATFSLLNGARAALPFSPG